MKNVLAYVRVSTTKQGEKGVSLQEQRSSISEYCKRHGLAIYEWYEEQETAAAQGRRVFATLIKRLQKTGGYGLVVHKIDRSARNLKDWALVQDLIDSGVAVHFAHESLDLNTRGGRLAADIQAVVAADYIRNLRDEVLKGFYGRLKQGFYPLRAPLGYLDNGGGKVKTIDPKTAPYVRTAFELYDAGDFTVDTLRVEMHKRGMRSRTGAKISRSGMHSLLRNAFYIGLMPILSRGELFSGNHVPIIRKALFERVQRRLSGRGKQRGYVHDFTYRRMIACAHCHGRYVGELQKGRIYYRCHTKGCPGVCFREDRIDRLVDEQLRKLRLGSAGLTLLEAEASAFLAERLNSKKELLVAFRLRLNLIQDRLARLTDAYVDRVVDRDTYAERRDQLLHARVSVEEECRVVEAGEQENKATLQLFFERLKALHRNLNEVRGDERRELLSSVTSNLNISQEMLAISWQRGFRALAERAESEVGGPLRDEHRTIVAEVVTRDDEKAPVLDQFRE